MPDNEKPLPKPPNTAFGRKRRFDPEDESGPLLADRMVAALAEGKLEEFLKQEMPDNEYARNLAGMMMGMTGMLPVGGSDQPPPAANREVAESPDNRGDETSPRIEEVPEDVRAAVQSGDVKGLMDMLRREHHKRMPGAEPAPEEERASSPAQGMPAIDKDLIDALIGIARDNSVTMDWVILRAIKVYVLDYRKTGRL